MADVSDSGQHGGHDYKSAVINDGSSGDNTIIALVSSKKLKIFAVLLVADGTVNVRFESNAGGTAITGVMNLEAREGFTLAVSPPAFLFETTAGQLLNLELSAAVTVNGFVSYWDDDD